MLKKKSPQAPLDENEDDEAFPSILNPQEAQELYAALVAERLLPFDVQYTLTNSVALFGALGNGERIGRYARIKGPSISNAGEEEVEVNNQIGVVIGDLHGRVVVQLPDFYLGWLNPEQFELVDIFMPTLNYIH
jgi:hypothetical protein